MEDCRAKPRCLCLGSSHPSVQLGAHSYVSILPRPAQEALQVGINGREGVLIPGEVFLRGKSRDPVSRDPAPF